MTTYGKYQPGKCGSCESNTATTVHNERSNCVDKWKERDPMPHKRHYKKEPRIAG